jgi:hypothetical protein
MLRWQARRRYGSSGGCRPSQIAAGVLQPNMAITFPSEPPALVPQHGESCQCSQTRTVSTLSYDESGLSDAPAM